MKRKIGKILIFLMLLVIGRNGYSITFTEDFSSIKKIDTTNTTTTKPTIRVKLSGHKISTDKWVHIVSLKNSEIPIQREYAKYIYTQGYSDKTVQT